MLCGPLYSPVGRLVGRGPTEEEKTRCIEGLRAVGEHASGSRVLLGVEPLNRFETYFLNTQADTAWIIDHVGLPCVQQMYDTFHANIEEKDVAQAIHVGGARIKHVHISANDRATPGEDHVLWSETFAALKAIKYDRWLTIEAFGMLIPELAAATCIWRKMAPNEEHVARGGLTFIRNGYNQQNG
jgi:D-psicose/D-tagatose/L-ribulose 3-epimerase